MNEPSPERRPHDQPVLLPIGIVGVRSAARPRDLVGAVAVWLFLIALVLGAAVAGPLRWLLAHFNF